MARPTCEQERELERLENLAATFSAAIDEGEALEVRMRQINRRALGDPALLAVLEPGIRQTAVLCLLLRDCREQVIDILAVRQDCRVEANKGRMK